MPDQIKIALVGLGWVGQARHIPAIRRNSKYQLVGVLDHRPGRAAEVANRLGLAHHSETRSLVNVSWLNEVDAIAIATPPMAHCQLACEALERGLHVITEKPFAMNVAEGQMMVDTARKADKRLAVVHNFQFARSMQRLIADTDCGYFGKIRGVRAIQLGNPARRLPEWYQSLPLGLFYDESPHLLYLMRRFAGPLKLLKSVTVTNPDGQNTPAQVDAWFSSTDRDCPVTLSCNFESSLSEWYLQVHGENGVGMVDIFRDIYLRLPNDGGHGTKEVLRTSIKATWQHWAQHVQSGIQHLTGRLSYGNDEVFDRFADAANGDAERINPISGDAAFDVLRLQHDIIEQQERLTL